MPVNARSLTLTNLRHRFGVQLNSSDRFFTDWLVQSPVLSDSDLQALDRIQRNYDYLSQEEPPLEEVVKLVVVSPLLDLAGFYQPPFLVKTEVGTTIEVADDPDLSIQGKIDILVIQDALWVLAIESKPARLDVTVGIPQALTYLLSAPTPQSILYGMVTNGREVLFLSLDRTTMQYTRSPTYRLLENAQERKQILQGLKVISSLIQPN
ncbi:MAG: restriction endonuclease subunit R [Plectolyngbya sp. WJT66-NPBG17]|jgi:predicted type IV restriction endonuclease|nr:restriction endonuclease subunit R [Plectolyngbya sp. WJT66-NPBG17]